MTTGSALIQTKTSVPGSRRECPDNCRYRNKLAPFCSYCMYEVLRKLGMDKVKEKDDGDRKGKEGGPGQI